jgi:hypothetical protein
MQSSHHHIIREEEEEAAEQIVIRDKTIIYWSNPNCIYFGDLYRHIILVVFKFKHFKMLLLSNMFNIQTIITSFTNFAHYDFIKFVFFSYSWKFNNKITKTMGNLLSSRPRHHRKLPAELNREIFLCFNPAAQRKFICGLGWDFYAMFRHRLLTKVFLWNMYT